MKAVPSYTKILTLGSMRTENALVGEVVLQEKVDGSQFGFGVNEDGELVMRSHHLAISLENDPNQIKMFLPAMEYITSIKEKIKHHLPDTYFYCEYLSKPKHNVLKYERIPKNHLVLFDAISQGKWIARSDLKLIADDFDIDLTPELYRGTIERKRIDTGDGGYKSSAVDFIKRIVMTTPAYLGFETVEGVVIKNYNQTILLGGNVFMLFTKYVNEKFKERHKKEWKDKGTSLQDYFNSFKSEARWLKAIQCLQEKGELTNTPKDIPALFEQVNRDIIEEEKENIKAELYKKFKRDLLRASTKGLAEWYKEKLLEVLK